MVTDAQKERILNLFCDLYDGREKEIGFQTLVYGDLLLIVRETGIPMEEVTLVLSNELEGVR